MPYLAAARCLRRASRYARLDDRRLSVVATTDVVSAAPVGPSCAFSLTLRRGSVDAYTLIHVSPISFVCCLLFLFSFFFFFCFPPRRLDRSSGVVVRSRASRSRWIEGDRVVTKRGGFGRRPEWISVVRAIDRLGIRAIGHRQATGGDHRWL